MGSSYEELYGILISGALWDPDMKSSVGSLYQELYGILISGALSDPHMRSSMGSLYKQLYGILLSCQKSGRQLHLTMLSHSSAFSFFSLSRTCVKCELELRHNLRILMMS